MPDQAQLLPGTLDLLILRAVSLGPLHGYGILLRIAQISGQALIVEQGALYPGLVPIGSSGTAEDEMGCLRCQSTRKVLRADGCGAKATTGRNRKLESSGSGHRQRAFRATGRAMRLLDALQARLSAIVHRSERRDELEEELLAHLQHRADDLERSGISRAEAERQARIEFGGVEHYREESHAAQGWHWAERSFGTCDSGCGF